MQDSCRRISFVKSRMRKSRTSGSVRGIPCKGYVYLTGGYHCHVDTEVTYNNNGILEITYSYNVLETTGEAVAVYDLNTGTVLEHQDWQDDMIRLLQGYLQKYKK